MKNRSFPFLIIIIFTGLLVFLVMRGGVHEEMREKNIEIEYVNIANKSVRVELAFTPEEHERGLSGKVGLAEDEGMLFIFEQPGEYHFWMKGMNFPIDMIWLNEDGEVIYIKENAQPEAYLETYGPEADAKYVLEVVAGFSEKNNLQVGDRMEFPY